MSFERAKGILLEVLDECDAEARQTIALAVLELERAEREERKEHESGEFQLTEWERV